MKVSISCPAVASTIESMWKWEWIFRTCLIQVCVIYTNPPFPIFFCTTTTFASHLGNFTSLIIFDFNNRSTSSCMMIFLWGANFLLFCCIGLKCLSIPSLCVIISLEIPVISSCFHAKVDILHFKKDISSCSISLGILVPISTEISGLSSSMHTVFTS